MRARRAADLRLTTTTDAVIEAKLNAAAFLRRAYEVQTGFQRAPFFELQTERFALLAVDTGILKSIDPEQQRWLASALERSRGKFKLAILGHPVYAGGVDTGEGDPPFDQLHQLLREHEVNVVMGGDTHSLEYYREHHNRNGAGKTMHHFVNGGGGAYLSIGTPLDWPKQPPVSDCGFYPRAEAITAKLDAETPRWKWPMWWWVKRLGAWPSTVESMAAAFDYNHAPFFQSFIEVRVEFSTKSVRLIPHGVHGPLTWREFQLFGQVMPAGRNEDDPAEFTIPMDSQR
jgi:hypothetical protein